MCHAQQAVEFVKLTLGTPERAFGKPLPPMQRFRAPGSGGNVKLTGWTREFGVYE
jgi:hypothetical protein